MYVTLFKYFRWWSHPHIQFIVHQSLCWYTSSPSSPRAPLYWTCCLANICINTTFAHISFSRKSIKSFSYAAPQEASDQWNHLVVKTYFQSWMLVKFWEDESKNNEPSTQFVCLCAWNAQVIENPEIQRKLRIKKPS